MLYEPESSPDTDDEYEAMEDVRTRVDASIARDLQDELDAEAASLTSSAARPSSRPGITIGRCARPSGAPRQSAAAPAAAPSARSKRQRSDRPPLSADPILEDYAAPGFRYPPQCRHRRKKSIFYLNSFYLFLFRFLFFPRYRPPFGECCV